MSAFRSGARHGEPFFSRDSVTVIKAAAERTGGTFLVAEQLLMAGSTRPPRTDTDGDEILYLLDGILDVQVGSEVYLLERGGLLYVPRGQSLALRVLSETVRILVIAAPAGTGLPRGLVTDW